jgi:2-oxo-4-hydroxy-4-carboxy-5-ureidoimidazoline decarboxylase
MLPIHTLNQLNAAAFIHELGGIYEHSPWVAGRTAAHRPFANREALVRTMRATVDQAGMDEKIRLIRAHPDLGGKLARAGALTPESTREQAGLGLDRLSDAEYARLSALNTAYTAKFGFPFVICARLTTRADMMQAFEKRLAHDRDAEIAEALDQIHHIARLRLEDRIV